MELAPLEDGVGMELVFAGGLRDCLPGFDLTDDLELELLGELTPLEGHGWFSFGKGTTLTACLIYGVQSKLPFRIIKFIKSLSCSFLSRKLPVECRHSLSVFRIHIVISGGFSV